MQNNVQKTSLRFWLVLVAMIGTAALTRILPHPYNFTPIAAVALFGGAHFRDKVKAFLVPLLALLISDAVLYAIRYPNYLDHMLSTGLLVYGSFALIVCLGILLQRRKTAFNIAAGCVAGSVLFFLITNFGAWVGFDTYPKTIAGLVSCYVAAIPFYQNTLLADALFTVILFGGFALLESRLPQLQENPELVRVNS